MAYTAEDLQAVTAQKVKMGSGGAVTQVRSANGTSLTYQGMTLKEINSLINDIQASLDAAARNTKRSRSVNVMTSKGL